MLHIQYSYKIICFIALLFPIIILQNNALLVDAQSVDNSQTVNYFQADLSCQRITNGLTTYETFPKSKSMVVNCIDICANLDLNRVALRPSLEDSNKIECGCFRNPTGSVLDTPGSCDSIKCADGNPCGSKEDYNTFALYVVDLNADWLAIHRELLSAGQVPSVPNTTGKTIGLAVGIPLGILTIIIVMVLYFRNSRSKKAKKEAEEREKATSNDHMYEGRGNKSIIADETVYDFTRAGDDKATSFKWDKVDADFTDVSRLSVESVITGSNVGYSNSNHSNNANYMNENTRNDSYNSRLSQIRESELHVHEQELLRQQHLLQQQQQQYDYNGFNNSVYSDSRYAHNESNESLRNARNQFSEVDRSLEQRHTYLQSAENTHSNISYLSTGETSAPTAVPTSNYANTNPNIVVDPASFGYDSYENSAIPNQNTDVSMKYQLQKLLDEDSKVPYNHNQFDPRLSNYSMSNNIQSYSQPYTTTIPANNQLSAYSNSPGMRDSLYDSDEYRLSLSHYTNR